MIITEKFVKEIEAIMIPFEGVRFAGFGDMCGFKMKLHKVLVTLMRNYPKIQFEDRLEIRSKTTVRFSVVFTSKNEGFYPSWSATLKYFKDFEVFTRGKRNSRLSYKLEEKDYNDAIICAGQRILGPVWYAQVATLFERVKILNGKPVMSKNQRDFVDKVRDLTWKQILLSEVRDRIIQIIRSGDVCPTHMIPLDNVKVPEETPAAITHNPVIPQVKGVTIKPNIVSNSCKLCKKWMASRNTGDSNLSVASCPVKGCKTKASDGCGNFRHI